MDADTILNMLLSFGFPGIVVAVLGLLIKKYAPDMLKAYKEAKATEQKAFNERQKKYEQQTEKIVEAATASTIAVDRSTSVIEQAGRINQEVIAALSNFNASFRDHDKRTEEINVGVNKILENARRAKS